MAGPRRKKKQHFGRIHAFSCGKASFKGEHSLIGGPGFSRVVHCNDPEGFDTTVFNYASNYVSTTKYNVATFLPKSLFEQFRRVANLYFLICAILSFTSLSPYSPVSNVVPLVVVMGVSMAKELLEDWRRNQQVTFFFFKTCYQVCVCWIDKKVSNRFKTSWLVLFWNCLE